MAKCDTKAEIEKNGDCGRCLSDFAASADLDWDDWKDCKRCGLPHLVQNMSEKIVGRLCEPCLAEYECELLKQMVPAGEMQKS